MENKKQRKSLTAKSQFEYKIDIITDILFVCSVVGVVICVVIFF